MTDNFYKSEIDRELLLNIEIQKQNLKSLPAKFKPQKKVNSPVTEQMIEDYKKQFRSLYKRGKGNTAQFFKFLIPGAVPDREEADYVNVVRKELNQGQINGINGDLDIKNAEYKKLQDDVLESLEYRLQLKKDINKIRSIKDENIRRKAYEDYSKEIKAIERYLNVDSKIEIEKKLTEINELKKILEENDENKLFNEKYFYTIAQNNNKKLSEYAETVKRMNEGQIDLTRGQGESEQDYYDRLVNVGTIGEDLTIIHLYNSNEFKQNLKKIGISEWKIENISKSFTDDDKFLFNKTAEGFKKYIKEAYGLGNINLEVDEYVSLIQKYLDITDLKKYKKQPGEDEKETETKNEVETETKNEGDLSEAELNEIYGDNIEEPDDKKIFRPVFPDDEGSSSFDTKEEPPKPPSEDEGSSSNDKKEELPPDLPIGQIPILALDKKYNILSDEKDKLTFINTETKKELIIMIGPKVGNSVNKVSVLYPGSSSYIQFIPLKNKLSSDAFDLRISTLLSYIFNDNEVTYLKNVIRYSSNPRKKNTQNISMTDFINFCKKLITNPPDIIDPLTGEGFRKSKKSKRKKIVAQKGASIKAIPKHVEFGKLILLLNKLVNQNILSIKDSNGINIPGLPNQKVSDKFVQLIQKIVSDEDITLKEVDDLNEKDSILYTVIMNKAGLKRKFNVNNIRALEALKNRLELVEGELEAGNDNKDIVKELYEIGYKLAYLGAIKVSEAKIHYKQTIDLLKNN
jgi:hypothetical protein